MVFPSKKGLAEREKIVRDADPADMSKEALHIRATADEQLRLKLKNLGLTYDDEQEGIINAIAEGLPVTGIDKLDVRSFVKRGLIELAKSDPSGKTRLGALEILARMENMIALGQREAIPAVAPEFGDETKQDPAAPPAA